MSVFDDIIARVAPEDRAVLDKYPELKASVSKLETDLQQSSEYLGQWLGWKENNWDDQAGMTRAEKALRTEIATLQAKVNSGEGNRADAAALETLKREFQTELGNIRQQTEQTFAGMNRFNESVYKHGFSHRDEFGEILDPNALMNFMTQNKITDPDAAYDKMVASRRNELTQKRQQELDEKHKQEIQAAEQRGRELAAKEQAMGPSGVMPTDSTGGIVGVTARADAPAKVSDEEAKIFAEAKPGDGSLAALGYSKYRRGDFSSVQ